jgi:hypothetical protein
VGSFLAIEVLAKAHVILGRHPCTGMRIAKLEIKIMVALFLSAYDFDIVDAQGEPAKYLPSPNHNDSRVRDMTTIDLHCFDVCGWQVRPLGDPCYIKFRRMVD